MDKQEYLRQQEELRIYKKKITDAYVESWLESVKEHTFATDVHQITDEEADAFIKAHEAYEKNQCVSISKQLDSLVSKLGESVTKYKKVFVKTSSRSPKDVIPTNLKEIFEERLSKLPKEHQSDNNRRYALLAQLSTDFLLVTSVTDLMDLLIKSNRVYEDVIEAKEFQTKKFEFSIVVRQWYEPIHIDMEFRCFVCHGKLTAITQYNYLCFYDNVVKNKDMIQKKVQDFLSTLNLPEECVIDLFVGDDEIKVIEFNAFEDATGTLLFSWKTDRDVLHNGPLEFRVRTQPLENFDFIQKDYKQFFV